MCLGLLWIFFFFFKSQMCPRDNKEQNRDMICKPKHACCKIGPDLEDLRSYY